MLTAPGWTKVVPLRPSHRSLTSRKQVGDGARGGGSGQRQGLGHHQMNAWPPSSPERWVGLPQRGHKAHHNSLSGSPLTPLHQEQVTLPCWPSATMATLPMTVTPLKGNLPITYETGKGLYWAATVTWTGSTRGTGCCVGPFLQNLYLTLHRLKTPCSLQRNQPLYQTDVPLPLSTAHRYVHIWWVISLFITNKWEFHICQKWILFLHVQVLNVQERVMCLVCPCKAHTRVTKDFKNRMASFGALPFQFRISKTV